MTASMNAAFAAERSRKTGQLLAELADQCGLQSRGRQDLAGDGAHGGAGLSVS